LKRNAPQAKQFDLRVSASLMEGVKMVYKCEQATFFSSNREAWLD